MLIWVKWFLLVLSLIHESQLVSCFSRMLPFWGACLNSRGEGGVHCPLQPVEDNCSSRPHLMSWPCDKEAGSGKKLPSGKWSSWISGSFLLFHHCPSLVMLYFLKFREQVLTCLLQGDEQIHATHFQSSNLCVSVANNTPNKKGRHYYPYCKYVRSAGGFLERRFPWLVTVNTLTLPAPSL